MGRASSIDLLPPALREQLEGWLRDPSITQAEATSRTNALIEELDPERRPLSKSAVNRYSRQMDRVGAKMRQSRAMADAWVARLGSEPSGRIGHLVVEMMKTLVFEINLKLQETELDAESIPGVTRQVKELALAAARLDKASLQNEKRESEIRRRARREAAAAAEKSARSQGLSAETAAAIRAQILGVAA